MGWRTSSRSRAKFSIGGYLSVLPAGRVRGHGPTPADLTGFTAVPGKMARAGRDRSRSSPPGAARTRARLPPGRPDRRLPGKADTATIGRDGRYLVLRCQPKQLAVVDVAGASRERSRSPGRHLFATGSNVGRGLGSDGPAHDLKAFEARPSCGSQYGRRPGRQWERVSPTGRRHDQRRGPRPVRPQAVDVAVNRFRQTGIEPESGERDSRTLVAWGTGIGVTPWAGRLVSAYYVARTPGVDAER